MTAGLVAFYTLAWTVIGFAAMTAWIVWREWQAARRRRHEDQAIALTRPLRCPCGAWVYDLDTHRRLAHQRREVGAEDSEWWAGR